MPEKCSTFSSQIVGGGADRHKSSLNININTVLCLANSLSKCLYLIKRSQGERRKTPVLSYWDKALETVETFYKISLVNRLLSV